MGPGQTRPEASTPAAPKQEGYFIRLGSQPLSGIPSAIFYRFAAAVAMV